MNIFLKWAVGILVIVILSLFIGGLFVHKFDFSKEKKLDAPTSHESEERISHKGYAFIHPQGLYRYQGSDQDSVLFTDIKEQLSFDETRSKASIGIVLTAITAAKDRGYEKSRVNFEKFTHLHARRKDAPESPSLESDEYPIEILKFRYMDEKDISKEDREMGVNGIIDYALFTKKGEWIFVTGAYRDADLKNETEIEVKRIVDSIEEL